MSIDRARALLAIKTFHHMLAEVGASDPGALARLSAETPAPFDALVERACAEVGLPRDAYEAALLEDRSLRELFASAADEVWLDPADPGPYAEISRESPAGTPANYHVHPWNGILPVGGVGGSGPAPRRVPAIAWRFTTRTRR